jgi:hypothetical protein
MSAPRPSHAALAAALAVPYLFCADAEEFQAERIRAKNRPPLRAGSILS